MRAPRLLVAALVAALGITLLVAPSPASAVVRVLKTTYRCQVNGTLGPHGRAKVRVRVNLPRRVQLNDRLPGRRISVRMKMPSSMTDYLRSIGADSIDGSSADAYYRIGHRQKDIRHLHVPRTEIPATGDLVLHARGRAVGHTFRRRGPVGVFVANGFTTTGTVYGTSFGDQPFEMGCNLLLDAPDRIATIRVVR